MIYRKALLSDANQIALLHADSWRRTYRGLFSDEFLDSEADAERIRTWQTRLKDERADQCVYVVDNEDAINGFVCAYGNEDANWGSLIDNLHVSHNCHRQGIGTQLMNHALQWLHNHYPTRDVYLWVMERNLIARQFYETLGAVNAETVDKPNPVGGGSAFNCRYIWTSDNISRLTSASSLNTK